MGHVYHAGKAYRPVEKKTNFCLLHSVQISNQDVRGLSGKFAETANKTRIVYHRLLKFCIHKYQISGTVHTQYD